MPHDVVIIGAGVNGLVAAALLARGGLKPLVLERAERVGGCVVTSEIAPGVRGPALSHDASVDPAIARTLDLEKHGLRLVRASALASAPAAGGRLLTLWADRARAAQAIGAFSRRDAERYAPVLDSIASISRVLRALTRSVPPSIENPDAADLIGLLKAARAFRGLGKADAYRLLRWLPMPAADLVDEWFDTEPLRALIAAGGVLGSFLGPRSPGSAAVLLLLASGSGHPIARGWSARGGPGAVSEAMASAARAAGAEIRVHARVREIVVQDGKATGVVLATGERVDARSVLSNADPRQTLLGLVDPVHLPPELAGQVRGIRVRGTLAKINFVVTAPPRLSGVERLGTEDQAAVLSGIVRLCPNLETMERAFDAAKYGRWSKEPCVEFTVPTMVDPELAPDAHVVSAYVQYAPYQLRDRSWDSERDRFAAAAVRTIEQHAPGFERSITAMQVITPLDLERTYGMSGGHIFHGELALDQLFVARPLLGWARFETPIRNLFLCGAGTHPGTGVDGRSGALAAKAISRALRTRR